MMEFLLLSLKSVCMIAIRALTGMQLISNEEKMLRWQTHGGITANYCFHSSNFLRGHVHMGIRWQDFTGANPSKLTLLLTSVCILQYISCNLHQFSLHIFQCDCRWCIIYLQFVFIYYRSTSLPGGSLSVSDAAFGRVQVSSSDEKGVFPDW